MSLKLYWAKGKNFDRDKRNYLTPCMKGLKKNNHFTFMKDPKLLFKRSHSCFDHLPFFQLPPGKRHWSILRYTEICDNIMIHNTICPNTS